MKKIYLKSFPFELGKIYTFSFCYYSYHSFFVKFIQTTEKGFNLLDIRSNKCILKKHIYKNKYDKFIIPEHWIIESGVKI